MTMAKLVAAGALIVFAGVSPASAQVQISLRDGLVTLVATNATVRQILTEWARVGETTIVNVERIPGEPLTLQLTDVPEAEALDLLLKSVTGYMAAPRSGDVSTLSRYDRILVLPTPAAARVPVTGTPQPVFQQPAFVPPTEPNEIDEPIFPPRGPLFPPVQQPPGGAPFQPVPGMPFQPDVEGEVNFPPDQINIPAQAMPVESQPATPPADGTPFPGATIIGTPRPGMVVQPPASQPGPGPGFFIPPPQPIDD